MRPHRLTVTAFGAFAGTEQVVFDDLDGLFLLHGETGAGKTTLLDAIAFALYGRVPGERGSARRLRSDHAPARVATEVELEATIGGRRLRITRRPEQDRPKRSGGGTTRDQACVRLAERGPDGTWTATSSRVGEADAEIAGLMGMSAEQFFQVVLLPQGRFARFLHASAQDKETLLKKLFGTDRFGQVEGWLADRRRAADKEVAAAEEAVDLLVAQLAQAAGAELPRPDVSDPAGESSQAPWQATWAAALAAAAAAGQDAAVALVAARTAELDAALAASAAAERLADRQVRRRDALRSQQDLRAATPELERLPGDPSSLRAAAQEQQAQAGRLEELRAVARQADDEDATAAAARDRAAGLGASLDQATSRVQALRDARPAAQRARDEAARAAGALPAVRAQADAARQRAGDAAALAAAHQGREQLREAHLTAREAALAAQAEALRVRAARIDGMRAELAAQMADGTPCPVCGSLDHPDPVDAESFPPVSRGEEDAAFTAAAEAARAADAAGQQVAAADAVIGDLVRRLDSAGWQLPPPATVSADALAAAASAAAASAEQAAAEESALSATAATLAAGQAELDDLDRSIAEGQATMAELTQRRAAAASDAAAAAARAARSRADLAARLGGAGDLETAIAAAARQADALLRAADVAALLDGPDLDVPLDPPAPVADAAAAASAARQAHADANAALGTARDRVRQLAELRPRLDQALAALGPLRDRAGRIRRLADLAEGRGANKYKMTLSSFVLAARLEEVAAAASERLLAMTAGRYRLVHSDATRGNAKAGLSLLACDAWTGTDRDTATLSGGETFLASLALALGLADVVTAESAGTPMEALFIDEGFGTLDEDTLDEVMNVLDGLRAGGRIVGIVSHVPELRQRIPARIHVRKSRAGSHVEVVPG